MPFSDFLYIFQWWLTIFIIGIIFLPLTSLIFHSFLDRGYIFSKIIGIALISYIVFILGILKILPFTETTIFLVSGIFLFINVFIFVKVPPLQRWNPLKGSWKPIIFEEIIFLSILIFWAFIHAHGPDIHGLEKYMDFGFINSILRADYFPPKDMWLTPFSINYYYFGHLATAVLTKLSFLPSNITYNLMLSTISAFIFGGAFSIGFNLFNAFLVTTESQKKKFSASRIFSASAVTGFLSGLIITFAGNLHAIYSFFKPYPNESPVPFWNLMFSPSTLPNSYWYPNATRFIENTIHEFPIYSFVVSDLHGHVLDIPFVLLIIAVLLSLLLKSQIKNAKLKIDAKRHPERNEGSPQSPYPNGILRYAQNDIMSLFTFNFSLLTLLGFILAIMYMTNAWDGIIYFILAAFVLFYILFKSKALYARTGIQNSKFKIQNYISKLKIFISYIVLTLIGSTLFSLPFSINFKPFASGIGILCAPEFLTNIGRLGPFLFEKDHCLRSPIWQLAILYGFFYFWAISFIVSIFNKTTQIVQNAKLKIDAKRHPERNEGSPQSPYPNGILRYAQNDIKSLFTFNFSLLTKSDIYVLTLIIISTLLIIIPEFIYIKDIYPAHYRANTMFKLVYQSFIMLSIASAYISVRLILNIKNRISKMQIKNKIFNFYYVYLLFAILFFILVFIYPYFAINSYFGDLKKYYGLDGTRYLHSLYPTDYQAILWINKNIKGQPVILEAQGDSYTDYGRISTNTGLPTVLGWSVHEWLWRGNYDVDNPPADSSKIYNRPAPRIEEITALYESDDLEETKRLLDKYQIELVFIGDLERQKYPNLNEEKFNQLGDIIFEKGKTRIYKIEFTPL